MIFLVPEIKPVWDVLYRIVDFPLSNCANSGVDIVGVLTQYESVLLNSYVAAGGRWGLDAREIASAVPLYTSRSASAF